MSFADEAEALHEVAAANRPNLPIKDTSTWVAIVLHTFKDTSEVKGEHDFLWIKCQSRHTIRTLKYYYFSRHPLEDLELSHELYFPAETDQVKYLRERSSWPDNVVVLQVWEPEEAKERRFEIDQQACAVQLRDECATPSASKVDDAAAVPTSPSRSDSSSNGGSKEQPVELSDGEGNAEAEEACQEVNQGDISGADLQKSQSEDMLNEDKERSERSGESPSSSKHQAHELDQEAEENLSQKVEHRESPQPNGGGSETSNRPANERCESALEAVHDILRSDSGGPEASNEEEAFLKNIKVEPTTHLDTPAPEFNFNDVSVATPNGMQKEESTALSASAIVDSATSSAYPVKDLGPDVHECDACRKRYVRKPWTALGSTGRPLCTNCTERRHRHNGNQEALDLLRLQAHSEHQEKLLLNSYGHIQNFDEDAPINYGRNSLVDPVRTPASAISDHGQTALKAVEDDAAAEGSEDSYMTAVADLSESWSQLQQIRTASTIQPSNSTSPHGGLESLEPNHSPAFIRDKDGFYLRDPFAQASTDRENRGSLNSSLMIYNSSSRPSKIVTLSLKRKCMAPELVQKRRKVQTPSNGESDSDESYVNPDSMLAHINNTESRPRRRAAAKASHVNGAESELTSSSESSCAEEETVSPPPSMKLGKSKKRKRGHEASPSPPSEDEVDVLIEPVDERIESKDDDDYRDDDSEADDEEG